MMSRGEGTIVYTSSTAAFRGNHGQYAHAAAMGGRRMVCQSLNHELGPKVSRQEGYDQGSSGEIGTRGDLPATPADSTMASRGSTSHT